MDRGRRTDCTNGPAADRGRLWRGGAGHVADFHLGSRYARRKGRIAVQPDCLGWVSVALAKTGVRLLPMSAQIAVGSSFLPDGFHGDPADRIIVASAIAAPATLITRDAQILAYARRGHFRAVSA